MEEKLIVYLTVVLAAYAASIFVSDMFGLAAGGVVGK